PGTTVPAPQPAPGTGIPIPSDPQD
ncbi:MAG: hypothetical protein JWQ26_810, partial [Modestobacter sp.]|nr:hypothetical protein [Modestobacter sp.]